jgi:protein-tyrosine phosphatase
VLRSLVPTDVVLSLTDSSSDEEEDAKATPAASAGFRSLGSRRRSERSRSSTRDERSVRSGPRGLRRTVAGMPASSTDSGASADRVKVVPAVVQVRSSLQRLIASASYNDVVVVRRGRTTVSALCLADIFDLAFQQQSQLGVRRPSSHSFIIPAPIVEPLEKVHPRTAAGGPASQSMERILTSGKNIDPKAGSQGPTTGYRWAEEEDEQRGLSQCFSKAIGWALGQCFSWGGSLRLILESAAFQVFLILLLCLDIVIVLVEFGNNDSTVDNSGSGLWWTSVFIMCLFSIDLLLRGIAYGRNFFTLWNLFDTIVVVGSMVLLFTTDSQAPATLVVVGRAFRLLRLVRIVVRFSAARRIATAFGKRLVSQNKRRLLSGQFDLDLTYITDRVIAMSLPSLNVEGLYRNPIAKVGEFLDIRHPDSYVVVNLCSEREYPTSYFHDRVIRVPFEDHNPPRLDQIVDFTRASSDWLLSSPSRVMAIHCKGGKGRTGVMVSCLLMELNEAKSPTEALDWFAERRTMGLDLNQGVSGASQRRYVAYFALQRYLPVKTSRLLYLDFVRISEHHWGDDLPEDRNQVYIEVACERLDMRFSSKGLRNGAMGERDLVAIDSRLDRTGAVRRQERWAEAVPGKASRTSTDDDDDDDEDFATRGKQSTIAPRGPVDSDTQHSVEEFIGGERTDSWTSGDEQELFGNDGVVLDEEEQESSHHDMDCWGIPVVDDFRVSLKSVDRDKTLAYAWFHSGALEAIARMEMQRLHTLLPCAGDSDDNDGSSSADEGIKESRTEMSEMVNFVRSTGHQVRPASARGRTRLLRPDQTIVQVTVPKSELDVAWKDSKNRIFPPDFHVELFFTTRSLAVRRQFFLRRQIQSPNHRADVAVVRGHEHIPTPAKVAAILSSAVASKVSE